MDTIRPPRSPSPSSSPTLEDDIAHTDAWLADDGDSPEADRKGKGRQQNVDLNEDNTDLSDTNSYAPKSEQEHETRRVEEVCWLPSLPFFRKFTRRHLVDTSAMGNS
jgi:hypothetical protein